MIVFSLTLDAAGGTLSSSNRRYLSFVVEVPPATPRPRRSHNHLNPKAV